MAKENDINNPTEIDDDKIEVKWLKYYSSNHQILLVGDGDFSFSLSLANCFGSASNMVATSRDLHGTIVKVYSNGKSNLENLKKLGATIIHGVDATNMEMHTDLGARKFDRIIFNFPHAGFHGKEEHTHLILKHRALVHGFFENASSMLRPDGEVHVNHKTTAPFTYWSIEELATDYRLNLTECIKFKKGDYPGYNNKRGASARCDEPFPLGECSTFKFRIVPGLKKKKPKVIPVIGNTEVNVRDTRIPIPYPGSFNVGFPQAIIKKLGLAAPSRVIECYWSLPPTGWIKVNTDGAAKGNPGMAGWGVVLRRDDGTLAGVAIGGLGVETCFIAECVAITEGIKFAVAKGWYNIWVESDSEAAVTALRTNKPHWKTKVEWEAIRGMDINLMITVNKREVNFAADTCARKGTFLHMNQFLRWDSPPFQLPLENHQSTYYSTIVGLPPINIGTPDCFLIFHECFKHADMIFGGGGYDVRQPRTFDRWYVMGDTRRESNDFIMYLEELHRQSSLRLQYLQGLLSQNYPEGELTEGLQLLF